MYKDPASRNPEKYFRLEFHGSSFLHKLANALVCMGDDTKLKISNEGLSISQMDTAEVALVEVALPKFSFKSFSFRGKEIVVPVKSAEFYHFTKNAKTLSARSQGSTILTGELNEPLSLNCYFIRRNANVFKEVIGVMDLETVKEEPVIEVTYKNWFILSSSEFASCINALVQDDNDIVRFYLNKEKGLIVETGQSSTDNAPNEKDENEESNDKIIRMIYPSLSSLKEIESKRDNVINKKTKQLQKGKLDVAKQSELAEVIESKKQAPNTTANEFRSFVTTTTHAFVKAKFAKIVVKNCNISNEVIISIEQNSGGFKCVCFDFILKPGDVDIKKSAGVTVEPELPPKETQNKKHEKVERKKIAKRKRDDTSDEESEDEDDEEDEEDRHRRRKKDKKRKRREKEKQKARKKQKRKHRESDSDNEGENSEYDERSDIEDELESENEGETLTGSSSNSVFDDGENYAANYVREYGFIRFFLSHQIPEDEVPEQPPEGETTKGGPEDSDEE